MPRLPKARREAERLLWRAGFGPRPGEAERLSRLGRTGMVTHLLTPRGPQVTGPPPRVDGRPLDPVNVWSHDALWWLDRCVRTAQPLAERMTLNWHDHFATSNAKVGDVALMMAQYRTLRAGALGSFRDLAQAVAADGAMRLFLDMAGSHRDSPNENFARELFELFTLGVNNGYTERDIREAARAFTGVTYDWDAKRFDFDPERHDDGIKTVFGRRGRFTARDIVNMAVDHPSHAPYLCAKLWRYFTPRPVPGATLNRLVRAYRSSDTGIAPVLRIILTHPTLYADLDAPDQVKPPVVYVAGMLRRLGRGITVGQWHNQLEMMGQVLFRPPNVSGWNQDEAWLTPGTIQARFDAASIIVRDSIEDGSIAATQSPAVAIASAMAATGHPLVGPATRRALQRYAVSSVAGRTEAWEVKHYYPERQRVLRHLLLAGPEAQIC